MDAPTLTPPVASPAPRLAPPAIRVPRRWREGAVARAMGGSLHRPALALLLIVSLLLRLWGIKQGLPYSYNSDEATAFRPSCGRVLHPRLQPALLPQPAGLFLPAAHRVRALVRLGRRGHARLHLRPDAGVRGRARRRGGARHGCGVADLPGGREVLQQPDDRTARRRDPRVRVPAGVLQPPGTQRRPHPRARVARAVRDRRGDAPREAARLRDRGRGRGASRGNEVHGGDHDPVPDGRVCERCFGGLAANARRSAARSPWRSAWGRS